MNLETSEEILVAELFSKSIGVGLPGNTKIISIDKLVGDASTRRYYRVKSSDINYVVCLSDPRINNEQNQNFVNVQKCLLKNGISVPKIYDIDLKKGYILQEDLSDQTLLKELGQISSQSEEYGYLEKAIDEMIKVHRIEDREAYAVSSGLSFDEEKLMFEVNFTIENFLEKYLKANFIGNEKKKIKDSLEEICKKIASAKMVLTHRDYHTRNIMINNEKKFSIIDFQDARLGIPQYDLVSLVEDNYYSFTEENKKRAMTKYWEEFLKDKKVQKSYEEYLYLYDLMTLQRTFKALGTFGYIRAVREDERYLKYIGFSFENMRKVLLRLDGFSDLRKILCRLYYEN